MWSGIKPFLKASDAVSRALVDKLFPIFMLITAGIPPSLAEEVDFSRVSSHTASGNALQKRGGHTATTSHNSNHGIEGDIIRIISYAPIALFCESLRVQKAIIQSIVTPLSVNPCLTGCIKDLQTLWSLNAFALFGGLETGSSTHAVGSIRHGNNFPLANASLLRATSLIERQSGPVFYSASTHEYSRMTTVHVTFIRPSIKRPILESEAKRPSALAVTSLSITIFQFLAQVGAIILTSMYGLTAEIVLMACPTINLVILVLLRFWTKPRFANSASIEREVQQTARGGAALDVHVVVSNWNTSHLDVFCGYTSHLHALTNIPASVENPRILHWSCRILAIILPLQAVALACTIGRTGLNGLSAVVWLVLYVSMLLLSSIVDRFWPTEKLEKHVGVVEFAGAAEFSGRRSALAFLAMLPVEHKVGRWDWVDPFMPPNLRRKQWESAMDSYPEICKAENTSSSLNLSLVTSATTVRRVQTTPINNSGLQTTTMLAPSPSSTFTRESNGQNDLTRSVSSKHRSTVSQALKAYNDPDFQRILNKFKRDVGCD